MPSSNLTRSDDYQRLDEIVGTLVEIIAEAIRLQNPELPDEYANLLTATMLNDPSGFLQYFCRQLRQARHTGVLNQLLINMPMHYTVWVSQQHPFSKSQSLIGE